MRIAVDAMGGDFAPETVVMGVLDAMESLESNCELLLVGDQARIEDVFTKHKISAQSRPDVHHASQVVGMHESPSFSLKRKRNSSIAISASLAKEGKVDAIVSAGNTGAVVAASKLRLRFLKGVERPAIATPLPTPNGVAVLLDAGANVDSKPYNLLQFAGMGAAYSQYILGVNNPRIGLLSIGEEESKGNELTKATYKLLKASHLNFIGNIEGRDVLNCKADVIVADGFVGNVVLKVLEGFHHTLRHVFRENVKKSLIGQLGGLLMLPVIKSIAKKSDYEEYGGAPLLGVDGICIISHGSSSRKAVKNAIKMAVELSSYEVNRHIEEIMEKLAVLKGTNSTI